MSRFHLSIVVANFEQTKYFYLNLLECPLGRDAGSWVDIQFYGHQLTIHKESELQKAQAIDHFGLIQTQPIWESTLKLCKLKGAKFVMPVCIKNKGESDESGKFIVQDPAANLIEFKYYKIGRAHV